jgi:putative endonuclease
VHRLVYFETSDDPYAAITREKEIKGWRREKKLRLIERENPGWVDLLPDGPPAGDRRSLSRCAPSG